jgi:hypothetical protein
MTEQNSFLVRYRKIEVAEDSYPFWQDQVWADPDLDEATRLMVRLVDDPNHGREIGRLASVKSSVVGSLLFAMKNLWVSSRCLGVESGEMQLAEPD